MVFVSPDHRCKNLPHLRQFFALPRTRSLCSTSIDRAVLIFQSARAMLGVAALKGVGEHPSAVFYPVGLQAFEITRLRRFSPLISLRRSNSWSALVVRHARSPPPLWHRRRDHRRPCAASPSAQIVSSRKFQPCSSRSCGPADTIDQAVPRFVIKIVVSDLSLHAGG